MFRRTLDIDEKWVYSLSREFTGIKPDEGHTAFDLTNKIAKFVRDSYSVNAMLLLARGGFREKADIELLAETGWDYREGCAEFEDNATYLFPFHHMPYIHQMDDKFLNPLTHVSIHMEKSPGLVLYDREQMVRAEGKRGTYHFANPDDKKAAVVGILEFCVKESADARIVRLFTSAMQRSCSEEPVETSGD